MAIKQALGAFAICVFLITTNAYAIPTYVTNGAGAVTGVSALDINGALWDMTLHEGSFDSLFAAVGQDAIYTPTFALEASTALQLFTDVNPVAPSSFLGCAPQISLCHLATTRLYDFAIAEVVIVSDLIRASGGSEISGGGVESDIDHSFLTYATWSEVQSTIPEPTVAILIASNLIAFGVVRRKRRT